MGTRRSHKGVFECDADKYNECPEKKSTFLCLEGKAGGSNAGKKGCRPAGEFDTPFPEADCTNQCWLASGGPHGGNAFAVLDDATEGSYHTSDGTSSVGFQLPEKILYMLLGSLIAAVVIIAYRATVGKCSKARDVSLSNNARSNVELSACEA